MSYDKELKFAQDLAKEAGDIMRGHFTIDVKRQWKDDNTPVTIADTAINKLVIDRIADTFPDDTVIGEEESALKESSRRWVCDPVDGTFAFSHGLPISTFSLALTEEGVPVLGVVYDPFMDRLFWAVKGEGAFLNRERIEVSSSNLVNALIDLEGFPGSKAVIDPGPKLSMLLMEQGAHVSQLKSVILPSVLVATGLYTASVFNVPKPEDGAAVKIIVEEAGGRVTDLFGNDQRYDEPTKGFIASNGTVHQQLVDLINRAK